MGQVLAPPSLGPAFRAAFLALAALGGWGCPRPLLDGTEPPAAVLRAAGEPCLEARQCATGFCVDGLCCNSACAEYETCALNGLRGTCVARPLGAGCREDTQCPTGHCAPEGVCCNVECGAPCQTCTAPDLEGQCETASDNTDPQDRCEGACNVCFSGQCAPAVVGTNPLVGGDRGLACPEGLACDIQGGCRGASGSNCSTDEQCASGSCVAGLCLSVVLEPVEPPGLQNASFRRIHAAALRGDQVPCVLLHEQTHELFPTMTLGSVRFRISDAQVGLACRETSGWRLTPWFNLPTDNVVRTGYQGLEERLAHLVHLVTVPSGVVAVAFTNARDGTQPPRPDFAVLSAPVGQWCRMGAQWFHANGVLGAYRCLLTNADVDGEFAWSSVVSDGAGGIHAVVARKEASDVLHVECPSFQCTRPKVWAQDTAPFGNGTVTLRNGRPVTAELQGPLGVSLRVRDEQGDLFTQELDSVGCSTGAPIPLSFSDWAASPFNSTILQDLGEDLLQVTSQCGQGVTVFRLARAPGPSGGWAPQSTQLLQEAVNVEAAVPAGLMLVQRPPVLSFRLPGTPDREQSLDTETLGEESLQENDAPLAAKVLADPLLPMLFVERNDSSTYSYFAEAANGDLVERYVRRPARSIWMLRTRPDDRVLQDFGN